MQAAKCKVYQHPEREQIQREHLDGVPQREVARKYHFSQASLSRHMRYHLPRRVAKAAAARELTSSDRILKFIEDNMQFAIKARNGCDHYLLRDPHDPNLYDLGPRVHAPALWPIPFHLSGLPGPTWEPLRGRGKRTGERS